MRSHISGTLGVRNFWPSRDLLLGIFTMKELFFLMPFYIQVNKGVISS